MDVTCFVIDRNSEIPLYMQLKQYFLDKISKGELIEGDLIPTEMEIVKGLSISRATVRQSLNCLENEGYLQRKKGRGTCIVKPKIDEGFFQKIDSFNSEMRSKGLTPKTKVLELKKLRNLPGINENLKLGLDEPLILLSRLRYANDEPVVYVDTYLPFKYFLTNETKKSGFLHENFESDSLYTLLEEKYGYRIKWAERVIEAVNATATEAKLLSIGRDIPICLVRTVAYTQNDVPIEYSVARYRGDKNKFRVELKR